MANLLYSDSQAYIYLLRLLADADAPRLVYALNRQLDSCLEQLLLPYLEAH